MRYRPKTQGTHPDQRCAGAELGEGCHVPGAALTCTIDYCRALRPVRLPWVGIAEMLYRKKSPRTNLGKENAHHRS